MTDLVERLLRAARTLNSLPSEQYAEAEPCAEAADSLASRDKEIAELKRERDDYRRKYNTLVNHTSEPGGAYTLECALEQANINALNAESRATSAEARAEALEKALAEAHEALVGVVETLCRYDDDEAPEDPCGAEELCGVRLCNERGCIKDQRDRARTALAGSREGWTACEEIETIAKEVLK